MPRSTFPRSTFPFAVPTILAIAVLAASAPVRARAGDIAPGLAAALERARPGETFTAWVFLRDHGMDANAEAVAIRDADRALGDRVRWRRMTRGQGAMATARDLAVAARYEQAIVAAGARLRARSRWLNAVSVEATPGVLRAIAALDFVDHVRAVAVAPARERFPSPGARRLDIPASRFTPGAARGLRPEASPGSPFAPSTLAYGLSYAQLQQIQVPALHALGLDGTGVRVGMLDTGFRLTHPADAPVHVLAQYDFINGDSVTANQPGQDDDYQDTHGTLTLSLLAGYAPGVMIGPAYHADFVLAKTEMLIWEHPVEEDWWVEGIEWLESWGCDVVSSSLGYRDFDDPYPDYTYSDMDGDTCVTTIAADIAASLGVVVVNCLGNNGERVYDKMLAPADGDSVLGIGAVDSAGVVTSYSSRGPTYDGRIKPDLCARGNVDVCADAITGGYYSETGTSCSTPLVAGVCALLLQAHPEWTPMQLAARLKSTASRGTSPDTLYGWGIVRGRDALGGQAGGVAAGGSAPDSPAGSLGLVIRPNPSRGPGEVVITRATAGEGGTRGADSVRGELRLFDLTGRALLHATVDLPGPAEAFTVDLASLAAESRPEGRGRPLAPGVYLLRVDAPTESVSAKLLVLP